MNEVPGRWEDVFGPAEPRVAALAVEVRALIRAEHPGAVETARPGDGAVTFGHGPAKMKEGYAYLAPQRAWLNLGFYHGAELPDPGGLLEGTGKALRHVKLHDSSALAGLQGAQLSALIRQAVADKARRLGLT